MPEVAYTRQDPRRDRLRVEQSWILLVVPDQKSGSQKGQVPSWAVPDPPGCPGSEVRIPEGTGPKLSSPGSSWLSRIRSQDPRRDRSWVEQSRILLVVLSELLGSWLIGNLRHPPATTNSIELSTCLLTGKLFNKLSECTSQLSTPQYYSYAELSDNETKMLKNTQQMFNNC